MRRLLAGGAGVVEGATTADGATVEDIGRELMVEGASTAEDEPATVEDIGCD